MSEPAKNQVVCPRCGEIKLETPPGTRVLPTLGMAKKAAMAESGDVGPCDCGRHPGEAAGGEPT